jgi:hypothetical protein
LQVRGKKPIEINDADVAEQVDARDLKSLDGNVVRVRVPPPAPTRRSWPDRQLSPAAETCGGTEDLEEMSVGRTAIANM